MMLNVFQFVKDAFELFTDNEVKPLNVGEVNVPPYYYQELYVK